MKYLTGLPTFGVLMLMFKHVEDYLDSKESISKFQQFVLTLMRLRLNIEFKLIGYLVGVSAQTVSRVFYSVLHVMYVRYEFLVLWPLRNTLHASMPLSFKEAVGERVAVIIDCFEVFMERPSNVHASAQVYSQYKKGSTVKFLIGISPQGPITFISHGFGGRATDKFITETCGLAQKLQYDDIILADRGFTVHELRRAQGAEMHMPAF